MSGSEKEDRGFIVLCRLLAWWRWKDDDGSRYTGTVCDNSSSDLITGALDENSWSESSSKSSSRLILDWSAATGLGASSMETSRAPGSDLIMAAGDICATGSVVVESGVTECGIVTGIRNTRFVWSKPSVGVAACGQHLGYQIWASGYATRRVKLTSAIWSISIQPLFTMMYWRMHVSHLLRNSLLASVRVRSCSIAPTCYRALATSPYHVVKNITCPPISAYSFRRSCPKWSGLVVFFLLSLLSLRSSPHYKA